MFRSMTIVIPLLLATSLAAQAPVVVIDPGHGGEDAGVSVGNIVEKQLNLNVATALAAALMEAGFDARLTRTGDDHVSLDDRVSFAESAGAIAYISLHFGGPREATSVHGGAIFVGIDDVRSSALGQALAQAIIDLPLPFAAPEQSNFVVLRSNLVPAVLVELGSLSNPGERETVSGLDYQDAAVASLVSGIQQFASDLG